MSDKPTLIQILDPRTHYGRAKASTRHFITQRVTGALNVLFSIFLIWLVVSLAGQDRATMVATIANPFVAIVLVLMLVSIVIHMRNGMRDVIEDYFDGAMHNLTMTANTVFAFAIGLVAIGAIAKIVFWG